jgi:hypothetical protein
MTLTPDAATKEGLIKGYWFVNLGVGKGHMSKNMVFEPFLITIEN